MWLIDPVHPGWPAVLRDGPVVLRPYRRRDAEQWSAVRCANQAWLAPWEPSGYGSWTELNSPTAYRLFYQDLRRSIRDGTAMPFAITLHEGGEERYVGHLSLSNITRRAFGSGAAGYWIDSAVAGRGIMPTALALLVDHAFGPGGLHRVEVNIRPENRASRRVVEKLGFREEAYHQRYMFIDGAWRDHIGYALTVEDVAPDGGLLARWHRYQAAHA
ncbi:MAG TPA: GNAT family protein [Natronosporangium sp.]|nr:GNAT family protein [Natronosporangium sp.]